MNQIKEVSTLLIHSMIVFTLTVAPLSLSSQSAYANDEVDCTRETNDDGTPGLYKPGCKFDDALGAVNENPGGEGLKGMVEQFIGISFASAAVSSLIFKHTLRSRMDCPQNKNASITLRLMQAGALAYLLGEMKAKSEFTKASKLAVDSTFVPKAKLADNAGDSTINARNREENDKQLEAYETLIKVYEHKVKGIQAKRNLAVVAEVAYLGALGTELVMTLGHKATCSAQVIPYKGVSVVIDGSIKTYLAEATAGAVLSGPTALACAKAATALGVLNGSQVNTELQKVINGQKEVVENNVENIKDQSFISKFFSSIGSLFTKPSLNFKVSPSDISLEAEIARDEARAAALALKDKTAQAQNVASWSSASLACSSCPACVSAKLTSEADLANKVRPIQCCGASASEVVTGITSVPTPAGIMDTKVDIFIQKIPIIGSNQIEFIKPAILNTIEQFYFAKVMKEFDPKTPQQTIKKLSSFYKYLDQLENNFDHEIKNSADFKLYQKELAGDFNEEKTLKSFDKLKISLIQDAHAVNFMSILGFGAKLFLLNKTLGKFLRNKGLVKPRNRMYTFGAMGAINAAIVLFEGNKLSENKKYLEIVKSEKERFQKSHGIHTGLLVQSGQDGSDENLVRIGENEGADYLSLTRNQGITACAVPAAGKSFAPAPCPQVLPTQFLSELTSSTASGNTQVTPLLRKIPALVAVTTANAASGDDLNKPDIFGANLAALENNRSALKSQVDKLVKDYDEVNKPLTGGKLKNNDPLARTLANIQKTFKGTPIGSSAPTLGNLAEAPSIKEIKDSSEKVKSANTGAVAAIPAAKLPTSATGSGGFDFGDDDYGNSEATTSKSSGSKEQSLDEFVVNTGEVADRPEANIFQLISNRYLRSYPVLLEEVKPKGKAQE